MCTTPSEAAPSPVSSPVFESTKNSFLRFKANTFHKISSILPAIPMGKPKHVIFLEAGNYQLRRKNYTDAMDKYKDCLRMMKFGKEEQKFTSDEIDQIVVPALCGLAECAMEMKEYQKTLFYCSEALQFRPQAQRAIYLQSVANLQRGSFKAAMKFYQQR